MYINNQRLILPRILCIETSTTVCSVAINNDQNLLFEKNIIEGQRHSEIITVLIEELLKYSGIGMSDIDAVAVSRGPGSYTGLRVGYSTAKAICYSMKIPLITIDTLRALAYHHVKEGSVVVPMIDARRKEVYSSTWSEKGSVLDETHSLILTDVDIAAKYPYDNIILCGDGSLKALEYFKEKQITMGSPISLAKYLLPLAEVAFHNQKYDDIAYAVPHYFKSPNITKSIKNILNI